MKASEIITRYADKIGEAMAERYKTVLECRGQLEYKIYIWEDGEIECMETTSGSNNYLVSRDPNRELYYVTTVDAPCFDPWDCATETRPDDDDERERMEAEIIDWCIDEYRQNLSDILEEIIREKEQDEMLDEADFPDYSI